jgi:hypothetical protein
VARVHGSLLVPLEVRRKAPDECTNIHESVELTQRCQSEGLSCISKTSPPPSIFVEWEIALEFRKMPMEFPSSSPSMIQIARTSIN